MVMNLRRARRNHHTKECDLTAKLPVTDRFKSSLRLTLAHVGAARSRSCMETLILKHGALFCLQRVCEEMIQPDGQTVLLAEWRRGSPDSCQQ